MRVVVFRNVFIFFVSTTFGHNLHRSEPKMWDVIFVWSSSAVDSFKVNGLFKLKFTQPCACLYYPM